MIDVSCAIIKNKEGRVLVTQRSAIMILPLKWEFPGGKVEVNETAEESLIREIREELNIEIKITQVLRPYIHAYPNLTIRLMPFECMHQSGTIKLVEHANFLWLELAELESLDWAEADLPILFDYLKQEF